MSKPKIPSTVVTPSSTGGSITVPPAIWAKMQLLLALLPDQTKQAESTSLPPEEPPAALSPAINHPDAEVDSSLEASIYQESSLNCPIANSNASIHNSQASSSWIDTNHNQTADIDVIPNKNFKATTPLVVITDIEGYNFSTSGPLDPPPPARFGSMDDLVAFSQSWAKNHGYAIAKSSSHPGKNVYIKCDWSSHFCGTIMNNSCLKTASTKINFPFHIKGLIPTSKKITNKVWTLEVLNSTHNHNPSDGASSHAAQKNSYPSSTTISTSYHKPT
ncbi:hypothetical protein PCANC_14868 [Puccinia coronata f. sp. avenae]|uniref:FAR1 domain-containing protein n=1 Tax=Puccinia coronata f. sp. avenae TaxID=200324 RepID=A0A2N5UNR3_9BASI|nr:hypothetical protein PCANC_14868 [Puccinia coronata f. sp. avenae]